jgi:hypothetical protein
LLLRHRSLELRLEGRDLEHFADRIGSQHVRLILRLLGDDLRLRLGLRGNDLFLVWLRLGLRGNVLGLLQLRLWFTSWTNDRW